METKIDDQHGAAHRERSKDGRPRECLDPRVFGSRAGGTHGLACEQLEVAIREAENEDAQFGAVGDSLEQIIRLALVGSHYRIGEEGKEDDDDGQNDSVVGLHFLDEHAVVPLDHDDKADFAGNFNKLPVPRFLREALVNEAE